MVLLAKLHESKENCESKEKDEIVQSDQISFGEVYVCCVREALVKLRNARGISQSELAEKLGLKQPVVSRLETGESELSFALFYDWCVALKSKPEDVARAAHAIAVFKHQDESVFLGMLKSWISSPSPSDFGPEDLLQESLAK